MGVKLRESCDSCLTAKVKCGKGRPVCQRCLTNGNECQYSPSARAGRKHRSNGVNKPAPHKRPAAIEIPSFPSGQQCPSPSLWTPHFTQYDRDHMPLDMNNSASANPHFANVFDSTTPPMTHDDRISEALRRDNKGSITQADQALTPPFSNHFAESFSQGPEPLSASTEASFQDLHPTVPSPSRIAQPLIGADTWMANDQSYGMLGDHIPGPLDLFAFNDTASLQSPFGADPFDREFFDDPFLQPQGGAKTESIPQQIHQGTDETHGCDDCFASCLTALHSLHSHSWNTPAASRGMIPFDVILTINREAVRGCQAMMNCANCSVKNGGPVSTMLLGTVFGKVMSLYRAAVQNRCRPANDAQLALGAYTVLDEDRYILETEILLFELKKVQRIVGQFQAKCQDNDAQKDTNGVYEPQATYLATQLSYIIDFLQSQKEHRLGDT